MENSNSYQEKRAERAQRFRELAEKFSQQSENSFNSAHKSLEVIPMGQPILVGHHSERGHRNLLKKHDRMMEKGFELDEKAKYYERRAENAESTHVISSDDPEALIRLREKLEGLQKLQEIMKACNKIIRGKFTQAEKVAKMVEAGISEKNAIELMEPGRFSGAGFPHFKLTNNNGNMTRIKQRIAELETREQRAAELVQETGTAEASTEINGVRMVENVEANRLQLFYPGKPSDEVRTNLKRNGFRWSPTNGCWQSYLNRYQIDRAKTILS